MNKATNTNLQSKESWLLKSARKLPDANILFLIFIVAVILFSAIFQGDYEKASGGIYTVNNLLSVNGLLWFLYNIIPNFLKYPPLGIIIVGAIGFTFAEKVGLLNTLIKKIGIATPDKLILPIIVFLGIFSSIASDAGYIVLIPLAGVLYAGLGKNPLVGIAAAFAGVSGGFGANIIPTPIDGILGGITDSISTEAGYPVVANIVTMNFTFMFFSTIFLTLLITIITKKFIEKSADFYEYSIPDDMKDNDMTKVTDIENKGLKFAGILLLGVLSFFAILYFTGPLMSQTTYIDFASGVGFSENARNINPILDNVIVIMILAFLIPSIAYGLVTGSIKNSNDYVNLTVTGMKDMSYVLVFAVFSGNFLEAFRVSGLSEFVSNQGAFALISLNVTNPIVLMFLFMILTAFINLFIGSASAKWNMLAPVFIPMLLIASDGNLTAEVIQAGYRTADSTTTVIAPLMPYMGIIVLACKKYVPKFQIGDLIALMLPYSIAILIGWTALFVIWMMLSLPFGF